jgi:hypothetical protein
MAESMPFIQIDDLVREMTQEEFDILQAEQSAQALVKEEQKNARASALAKLAALGLTEEEIAAL